VLVLKKIVLKPNGLNSSTKYKGAKGKYHLILNKFMEHSKLKNGINNNDNREAARSGGKLKLSAL
jgi:hypothetical protein